jgi:hypothetical protein
MNLLAQSQAFLHMALLNDPLHQLACLTVLLDPLWIGISDADELDPNEQDYYEGNDPIQQALLVTRECFPEIYVEAVSALHRGVSRHDLDSLLCKGFGEAGIPMENLELVWYGIPLPAYGSQLSEPDFYTQFPQAEAVLKCFGVDVEAGEIPPESTDLAIMLAHRLRQMKEPICQQISWVLAWLWGVSGNSSIDMDYEYLSEFEPMRWERDNIEFAKHLIAEADEIMGEAMAALDYLHEHPTALQALEKAVQSARKLYTKTYPKGGQIPHDALCKLAQRLHLDGTAFTRGAL